MSDDDFEGPPEPKRARWEYKKEFGINTKMREVIELSIKVAQAEVETYKKKLDKLTYGS